MGPLGRDGLDILASSCMVERRLRFRSMDAKIRRAAGIDDETEVRLWLEGGQKVFSPGVFIKRPICTHSFCPSYDIMSSAAGPDGALVVGEMGPVGRETERVIRHSPHSTQSNPLTVDEVRRILLIQAESNPSAVTPAARSPGRCSGSLHRHRGALCQCRVERVE